MADATLVSPLPLPLPQGHCILHRQLGGSSWIHEPDRASHSLKPVRARRTLGTKSRSSPGEKALPLVPHFLRAGLSSMLPPQGLCTLPPHLSCLSLFPSEILV